MTDGSINTVSNEHADASTNTSLREENPRLVNQNLLTSDTDM